METYNLKEVNDYIQQVLAANFTDAIWITAEISQIGESKGQYYLEVVQKDPKSENIVAKASAAIWFKSASFLKKKLGDLFYSLLVDGNQIQFKARVTFHVVYGMKLNIEDIDPSFTYGMMEIERQKIIKRIRDEGLLHKNKEVAVKPVIKNIAVISSKRAAGLQDFLKELDSNIYGYTFNTNIYHATVQGKNVEHEIIENLNKIVKDQDKYECVVILRGGGSKLDLAAFDSYALSKEVAMFPLPVFTGIGHEIDNNVIELVVHTPLKTPTAVAGAILERNIAFESRMIELITHINYKAERIIGEWEGRMTLLYSAITNTSKFQLDKLTSDLMVWVDRLKAGCKMTIISNNNSIDKFETIITASDPKSILNKGYSLVLDVAGNTIKDYDGVKIGDSIENVFVNGRIRSTVVDKK